MTLNLDDFKKQDIKFDITRLQQSYKEIIKIYPKSTFEKRMQKGMLKDIL